MPWEKTEKEIGQRIRPPENFRDDTIRSKELEGAKGVSLILGKLKPEYVESGANADSMIVQALRFDLELWDMDRAKKWVADHGGESSFDKYANTNAEEIAGYRFDSAGVSPSGVNRWLQSRGIDIPTSAIIERDKVVHVMLQDTKGREMSEYEIAPGVTELRARKADTGVSRFKLKTVDIPDVEVFEAGTWTDSGGKKTSYTEKDLDLIVDAFSDMHGIYSFPVKLGHTQDQKLAQDDGLPAVGWLSSLRRVGQRLVADLVSVPKTVAELVRVQAYKTRSPEIAHGFKCEANGKTYKHAMVGLALLGADLPAIGSLSDIAALYRDGFNSDTGVDLSIYEIQNENENGGVSMDAEMLAAKIAEIAKLKDALAKLEGEVADAKKSASTAEEKASEMAKANEALKSDMAKRDEEIAKYKAAESAALAEKEKADEAAFVGILKDKCEPAKHDAEVSEFKRRDADGRKALADYWTAHEVDSRLSQFSRSDGKQKGPADKDEQEQAKRMAEYAKLHNLDLDKHSDYKRVYLAVGEYKPMTESE